MKVLVDSKSPFQVNLMDNSMRYILIAALILAAQPAAAGDKQPAEKQWQVDGVARKALVHIPTKAKETPTPVVFAFHGHGGNMGQAARSFSYHTHWPDAIVVYMQGLNTPGKLTDPEGKKAGWQHGRGDQDDRDLKFFDTVLASLKRDYKVHQRRIYSTGHSNGGAFTYLLWSTRGDVFAAFAPSAAIPGVEAKNLKPMPVLHVAGEKDNLVKWDWQKRTMDQLRKLNGCEAEGTAWDKAGDLIGTKYESKMGPPFVSLIYPGDHRFPSAAPALITKFFKENPRK